MRWPLLVVISLMLAPETAGAAPLDPEACKGITAEREGLVGKGVEADIARGPEWGKANLSPDRLREVARMIELNEQLTFRCGQMTVARPDGKPLLKKAEPPPVPSVAGGSAKKAAEPATAASTADPAAKPAAKKKKKAAATTKPPDASVPPAGTAGAASQKSP